MSELLDWQMELPVELSLLIDHLSFRFTSRFFYHPPSSGLAVPALVEWAPS